MKALYKEQQKINPEEDLGFFNEFSFRYSNISCYFLTGMVVLNFEDILLASDNNDHNSFLCKCNFFYIFVDAAYSNVICYGEVRKFFLDI